MTIADLPLALDQTTNNSTANSTTNGATNGTRPHSPPHQLLNGVTTNSPMYISGIGSILAIHFPSSSPQLQSLFYHHMLSKNIYLAERGFMALNIELGMEEVENFVEGAREFVERYRGMILAC